MPQEYLGDGAYVSFDGEQFRLFTERDRGVVHEIYLGPNGLAAFLSFVERMQRVARGRG